LTVYWLSIGCLWTVNWLTRGCLSTVLCQRFSPHSSALVALFTLLKVPCNHLSLSVYTVGPLSAWCNIDSLLHSSCSLIVHGVIISRWICFGVRIPTAKKADLELICQLEIINSVVITILCVSNRRITQCVLSCREPATCFIRAAISDMLIRAAMSDMPTRVAMICLLE
jgi:hypothetical protein